MSRHALACVVALALAGTASATPDDGAEYERVFAKRVHLECAPLELTIDGEKLGAIIVELSGPGAEPVVPTAKLAAELVPRVRSSVRAALQAALCPRRVTLAALRALGLVVVYDRSRLVLQIAIPSALTERAQHPLQLTGAPPEAADALRPSDV